MWNSTEFSEESDKWDSIKKIVRFPNADKSNTWVEDLKNSVVMFSLSSGSLFLSLVVLSINVSKCCNTLYLFKISYNSSGIQKKGLPSLFIKSNSLDKKLLFVKQSVYSLHSFQKKY